MKTIPGEIVHAHIMISSVPGLIPQMFSFLASKKFYLTSFFIHDKSEHTCTQRQKLTSADDDIVAKIVHEAGLRKYGKSFRHYHYNDGTCAVSKHHA